MSDIPDAPRFEHGADFIGEVGGGIDETHVTLGIYGKDLNPGEISKLLGCVPTHSHLRGEKRRRGPPAVEGAWVFTVKGESPAEPNELLRMLLARIPSGGAFWQELRARFKIRISFALFVTEWVRGFELDPSLLARLAAMGVSVGFSIYSEREGD